MDKFISNSAFATFLSKSKQTAKEEEEIFKQHNNNNESDTAENNEIFNVYKATKDQYDEEHKKHERKSAEQLTEEQLMKKKAEVEERVNKMTLTDIAAKLLDENMLTLSEKERRSRGVIMRQNFMEHGVKFNKTGLKTDYQTLRNTKKKDNIAKARALAEARDSGTFGINKKGERFTITQSIGVETRRVRDINKHTYMKEVAEVHQKFNDKRGNSQLWDGTQMVDGLAGKYEDGVLKINPKKLLRDNPNKTKSGTTRRNPRQVGRRQK